MADNKLVGQNYSTPDLVAKVTGKAKYAEDYKAEGMLWTKLLLSPMPHARITRLDVSAALAMPGVKAIITADDLPGAQSGGMLLGENVTSSSQGERILTKEPVYEGEPILALAAVDELTATEAIEKIQVEFVSANPTGPLHVGHGRGAAYGASVADLLEAVGHQVTREYYVNDAGRQMDILAVSTWVLAVRRAATVAPPSPSTPTRARRRSASPRR